MATLCGHVSTHARPPFLKSIIGLWILHLYIRRNICTWKQGCQWHWEGYENPFESVQEGTFYVNSHLYLFQRCVICDTVSMLMYFVED